MAKQYGLIIPGQQKKPTLPVAVTAPREISKPSIFDESSSDSDENGRPQLKMKSSEILHGPGVMERRMARRVQEKALAEDPTVFQYDELYDEMESNRQVEKQTKSAEPKKPKYIGRLIEYSGRRKLENELRVERQVQKEREKEGEEFKDKESFVTAAYRKKLEDMRKLEEQEKRDEYLEAIGDVTKQNDLDGFYRHLYEQKMGTDKAVPKPDMPASTFAGDEEISYKPIKSAKTQQRAYRKRQSECDDEADEKQPVPAEKVEAKKVHLENHIDADSDFSIDSSSSDDDNDDVSSNNNELKKSNNHTKKSNQIKKQPGEEKTQGSSVSQTDISKVALNLDAMKKEKEEDGVDMKKSVDSKDKTKDERKGPPAKKEKKDKREVWKKRTVGEVFDLALKRYFERKATRSG